MKKILLIIAILSTVCCSCRTHNTITIQSQSIPDTVIIVDENGDTIDIGISYDKPI